MLHPRHPDPGGDIARRDSRLRSTSPRIPLDASENGFVGYSTYVLKGDAFCGP